MVDKTANKAYQEKHLGKKGSRTPEQERNWRAHNRRRILARAMRGENVSYTTLKDNGLLPQLDEINKVRRDKGLSPTVARLEDAVA